MFKFLKFFMGSLNNSKAEIFQAKSPHPYDEDGKYINPKIGKLTDEELMIGADKARILHSKSAEDVKIKKRKKLFYLIHNAILNGKTQIRVESYHINQDTLVYIESLGYSVHQVIPNRGTGLRLNNFSLSEDDALDENAPSGEQVPYHYYLISWAAVETSEPAEATNNLTVSGTSGQTVFGVTTTEGPVPMGTLVGTMVEDESVMMEQ